MKTLFTAITSVLLMSLFHKVHLSNPDSEIVQNTSASDVRHEQKRSAPLGMVEVSHEKTTYIQEIPGWTVFRYIRQPPEVKQLSPKAGLDISAIVFDERGVPQQKTYLNSHNREYKGNEWNTNFRPHRDNPRSPMNPPNTPFDSSSNRDVINENEDPFFKRPVFPPLDPYNHRSRISQDSSSSNGARNYGNEESDRREQKVHTTFSNGSPTRQNASFNSYNGVYRGNVWNTNFRPHRNNPRSPMNPLNTPSDSSSNRDVINGSGGTFIKRPEYVSSDAHNPGSINSPDGPNQGNSRLPMNTPSNSSYNHNVNNRNKDSSTRRPGSDTFNAPKIVKKISPDSNIYASIVNDFGFKLIETMNLKTNFVLSPLSIFLALSMCYLGSNGSTQVQLEEVMGLNNNSVHGQTFHHGMEDLISSILLESSNNELHLANGLFFDKGFEYIQEFKEDIRKFYRGKVDNLDFRNQQESASVVDKWVSRNTKNMIPKLSEGAPSLLTRLLVVNAIFFKGIWKTQFPPRMTFDGKFYSSLESEKTVRTMQLFNETFPFFRSQDHRTSFIKLPYEGDQVSLIIALPSTIGENPMPNMRDEILCSVRSALNDTTIGTVAVPKFKFDYKLPLIEPLKRLGITHLFNINTADLSKMTPEKIAVSDILHKAVIDIDEQGTSASATTTFQLTFQSKKKDPDFIVNHPFAFYVVHEPTGVVLFNGKIFDIGQRSGEVSVNARNPNTQKVPENAQPGNIADISNFRRG